MTLPKIRIEPATPLWKPDIIDRVIRLAELAIEGKEVEGLSEALIRTVNYIINPNFIAKDIEQ